MELLDYLKFIVDNDASDLYLSTNAAPSAKVQGELVQITPEVMPKGRVRALAFSIMDDEQIKAFETFPELNLALSEPGIGRFRVNVFQQRNEVSMVIRNIKVDIPSLDDLNLPPILVKLIMQKRGLFLLVGGTGTGKSTTLASLIDHRNTHHAGHIITIEDPVEYVHTHKKSIVNQREVGIDTPSYDVALKNTLRQAPDVILIGEIRSEEGMAHAIEFAETGHLCVSTLHANNANQTLDRIINFFPEERHKQLTLDLSLNLNAIVSQRLIPTVDGKRVAAIEVLIVTSLVSDMIKRNDIAAIKEVMEKSENLGMQTFDTALFRLYKKGIISLEEALKNADSENNLRLKISLAENGGLPPSESDLSLSDDANGYAPTIPPMLKDTPGGLSLNDDG